VITIGGPSARLEQRFSATTARTSPVARRGESAAVGDTACQNGPLLTTQVVYVSLCKDDTAHKLGLLYCCTPVLLYKRKNTFQHIKRWKMCT